MGIEELLSAFSDAMNARHGVWVHEHNASSSGLMPYHLEGDPQYQRATRKLSEASADLQKALDSYIDERIAAKSSNSQNATLYDAR